MTGAISLLKVTVDVRDASPQPAALRPNTEIARYATMAEGFIARYSIRVLGIQMTGKMKIFIAVLVAAGALAAVLFTTGADGRYPLRDIDGIVHGSLTEAQTGLTILLFM